MNKIFKMAFLHEIYPIREGIFITPPTTVTKQNMEREKLDYVKVREKRRIPGYAGHFPKVNACYGVTYGNATRSLLHTSEQSGMTTSNVRYLQRTQSEPHQTSVELLQKPVEAIATPFRPASGKQHSQVQIPYSLSHTGKRRDEVFSFMEQTQQHRGHYQDLTGKVQHLPYFARRRFHSAPTERNLNGVQEGAMAITLRQPPQTKLTSHLYMSEIPKYELKYPKYQYRQPSAREKQRRDVYFERR